MVPDQPVRTAPAKKLDDRVSTPDAQVTLTSVRAETITASGPGDSSGPGLVVRLRVRNTTARTLDTSSVQVNVANTAQAPGTLVNGAPTDPLEATVRPGRSADATYAFLLPDAGSGPVTVLVYVTPGQPVVQFRGRAA